MHVVFTVLDQYKAVQCPPLSQAKPAASSIHYFAIDLLRATVAEKKLSR